MDINKILKELDYLKVIGIVLVVIGHCTYIYTGRWVFKSPVSSPIYRLIVSYVYTFHVPILVFVSGSIYYYCRKNKEKYKSIIGLVINKFKRLIIPFLCIGLFYSITIKYLICSIEKGMLIDAIKKFLLGMSIEYLWYLLIILNIFVLFYIYEKYMLSKRCSVIINMTVFIIIYMFSRMFTDLFLINRAIQYSIFFYLGYEFFRSKGKVWSKIKGRETIEIQIVIPILIVCSLILIFISKMQIKNVILSRLFSLINVLIAMTGIADTFLIVYLLNNRINKKDIQGNIDKIVSWFSKYSFKIYVLHETLIFILLSFIATKNINPTILVVSCFLLNVVAAIIISKVVVSLENLVNRTFGGIYENKNKVH